MVPRSISPANGATYWNERVTPTTPPVALCRRAVQHGLCRFLYLPNSALWPVVRARCLRDRHPRGCALDHRLVPVNPHRRPDGPLRYAPGYLVLRLDGDGSGTVVPAGAGVLGLVAVAAGQRCRRFLRLVGRADADRPARRGRCRIYRQVQLLRPARLDNGAYSRRRGLGFWRSLAGLSA